MKPGVDNSCVRPEAGKKTPKRRALFCANGATIAMSVFLSAILSVATVDAADYYVNPDPALASDGYDGTKKVLEVGTNHGPKRTLKGAMEIAGLAAGDVVHAARGVYDEGVMGPANNEETSNRVVVVEGVALVADEGQEVTFIDGYVPPTTPDSISTNGGPASVRCVAFAKTDKTGYAKGFTLRNGSTCIGPGTGSKITLYRGGGICYGTAIDCIITNCFAVRGGGAAHATLIRTRIESCNVVRGKNPQGGAAGVQATASIYCSFYDSYVSGTSTFLYQAVNCQFEGKPSGNDTCPPGTVVNSYLSETASDLTLDKCVVGGGLLLDAYQRPIQSTVIGKGSVAAYVYPAGFESEAGYDLLGRRRLADGKIDIGCYENLPMTFYVDAVNGNDAWDGLVATNEASASSTHGPRKTLAAAVAIVGVREGDEICALRGTYSEGHMYDSTTSATNRVVVPAGVGLFSAEGPDETIIEGALSEAVGGIGPDAVRGVFLCQRASVRGFTVRGGATPSNVSGGGIYLSQNSAAIGCRIVDNIAGARHGAYSADVSGALIRCYVSGNENKGGDETGEGAGLGSYFNCVFDGHGGGVYAPNGLVVNCSFIGKASFAGSKTTPENSAVYNSLFRGSSPGRTYLYRCLVSASSKSGYLTENDGTVFTNDVSLISVDAQYRPESGSLAVDFGNSMYAKTTAEGGLFPEQWAAYADSDYAGGRRFYNGMVDAGAGERDWRADYGRILGKGVSVTAATESVVATNDIRAVKIASGGRLELTWSLSGINQRSFVAKVEESGAGSSLTVNTNGAFFAELEMGTQAYRLSVPQGDITLTFDYAGEGFCLISDFYGVKGACISFR